MEIYKAGNSTTEGQKILELTKIYSLSRFYNIFSGNIVIPDTDLPIVAVSVRQFLKDHTEWVLGHEEDYWYITQIKDLGEV